MHATSQGIVDAFTKAIGLAPLARKASGPQLLLFDQKWLVNIIEENHSLVLTASPGQLAPGCLSGGPDWTYLPGDTTGITHIGKDPASGLVILHSKAGTAGLDAPGFQQWLEQFLVMLEHWSALLSAHETDAATPVCASSPLLFSLTMCHALA